MKSALTGALKSGESTATPTSDGTNGDLFSFPCLRDPAAELKPEEMAAQEAAAAEAANAVPVGSMPRHEVAAGQFDYEINPRNRRGSQELPSFSLEGGSMEDAMAKHSSSLQTSMLATSLGNDINNDVVSAMQSSLGMSPTATLLNEMPSHKMTGRTAESKKLRRHVLRGAVVVFVTAGYSGKRFIYERAKELGVRSVILDAEDSWCKSLVDAGVIEKFIDVDFSDGDMVFDRCMEALRTAKEQMGEVDGIVTFSELAVPLVSRLCEVCGLPGNSAAAVDNARNKHNTRSVMAAAGLPTPANMLLKEMPDKEAEEKQLLEAAEKVGFPAVLKPIHGAASLGVIRCDNLDELKKAYLRVAHELKSARVVAGAIVEGDAESPDGNAGGWICLDMIYEQYLDGPEVDCDIIFSEGKCVYGAISDNWPTIEPYFNETGSNAPSILPLNQQKELLNLSVRAVESLGFQMGVFHVEGKYTSKGAKLIEVNCRMGGGPVRDINLLVWGVDMVEEQLLCSVGIPSRPSTAPKPLRCIAEYSVNALKSGTLQGTDFMGNWEDNEDVLYARPIIKPGGKCVCAEDGMPTWVCEMMVEKPTVEAAIDFVKEIEKDIQGKLQTLIV